MMELAGKGNTVMSSDLILNTTNATIANISSGLLVPDIKAIWRRFHAVLDVSIISDTKDFTSWKFTPDPLWLNMISEYSPEEGHICDVIDYRQLVDKIADEIYFRKHGYSMASKLDAVSYEDLDVAFSGLNFESEPSYFEPPRRKIDEEIEMYKRRCPHSAVISMPRDGSCLIHTLEAFDPKFDLLVFEKITGWTAGFDWPNVHHLMDYCCYMGHSLIIHTATSDVVSNVGSNGTLHVGLWGAVVDQNFGHFDLVVVRGSPRVVESQGFISFYLGLDSPAMQWLYNNNRRVYDLFGDNDVTVDQLFLLTQVGGKSALTPNQISRLQIVLTQFDFSDEQELEFFRSIYTRNCLDPVVDDDLPVAERIKRLALDWSAYLSLRLTPLFGAITGSSYFSVTVGIAISASLMILVCTISLAVFKSLWRFVYPKPLKMIKNQTEKKNGKRTGRGMANIIKCLILKFFVIMVNLRMILNIKISAQMFGELLGPRCVLFTFLALMVLLLGVMLLLLTLVFCMLISIPCVIPVFISCC